MKPETARLSINILINTIYSFAPLQVGYQATELQLWDRHLQQSA